MWFTCDLEICGDSVECKVLMCDGNPEELLTVRVFDRYLRTYYKRDVSYLLEIPHVVRAIMKAYNDYIGE